MMNQSTPRGVMIDLQDLVSFEGFDFHPHTYRDQERTLLQPQLEAQGFTDITWHMGERDSFGPLTRVVHMTNPDGDYVEGIYG